MGRIKTRQVKRITQEAFESFKEEFTDSFDTNKRVVETRVSVKSKKLRNIIAGYATRLKKAE